MRHFSPLPFALADSGLARPGMMQGRALMSPQTSSLEKIVCCICHKLSVYMAYANYGGIMIRRLSSRMMRD
ncbi:hypothetical protein LHJMPILO_01323 [Aeromonas veronii]